MCRDVKAEDVLTPSCLVGHAESDVTLCTELPSGTVLNDFELYGSGRMLTQRMKRVGPVPQETGNGSWRCRSVFVGSVARRLRLQGHCIAGARCRNRVSFFRVLRGTAVSLNLVSLEGITSM